MISIPEVIKASVTVKLAPVTGVEPKSTSVS